MNIIAITQARISSTRLPRKILLNLGTNTALDLHLKRIKKAKKIDQIIVATTFEEGAEEIINIAKRNSCEYFQGDLNDVLSRFYHAAKLFRADVIVRLTSDCPLIDSALIDDLVEKFLNSDVDYASNCLNSTLPDGMDAEIFKFESLEQTFKEANLKSEREHVTPYIRNSKKFKVCPIDYVPNLGNFRLTLDTKEDYNLIKQLVDSLGEDASMNDYIDLIKKDPELAITNARHERNEGYIKSLKEDADDKSN